MESNNSIFFKKLTAIICFVAVNFCLFGYWFLPSATSILNYPNLLSIYSRFGTLSPALKEFTIQAYCWFLGIGISFILISLVIVLRVKKWDVFYTVISYAYLATSSIIFVQSIRTPYTGGGFDFTDIFLGFFPFVIVGISAYILKNSIKTQQDVAMWKWLAEQLERCEDTFLNPNLLMKREISESKKNCVKIDGKRKSFVDIDLLETNLQKEYDVIVHLIKLVKAAKENE